MNNGKVIFETFIDGIAYEFRVMGGPKLYCVYSYHEDKPIKRAFGETEEKAILLLVKILEK